ncbi:uncharacterized protein PHACADRAFT_254428 [Phanerochaete carnosa HHB-10118-sp]|uniref:Uncharacterized protein n=1 Tax=Phanerochaete carnosa (strain HHB-10118-sp) TaxID=650164 RepID=K5VZI2_PHACS|nr:uncharacterized protein PHACADRAFT_254428 [Phanerochaete carnosa HHB-10118-sp]EKM56988.1 hypothetical protein PHACADRAFT_254428 [Phanerochaete carnosa HHB-10118-sp]
MPEDFWHSNIGWTIVKPRYHLGVAKVSDLSKDPVIQWQHPRYVWLLLGCGSVLPTLVVRFGWGG